MLEALQSPELNVFFRCGPHKGVDSAFWLRWGAKTTYRFWAIPSCFRRITDLRHPKIRCCIPTFSGLFWGWAHRRHCRRYWQSRPVAQQLLVCLHACWVQRQDWHICQDQPPVPRQIRSALLIAEPPATHHAWPLPRAARQRRNRHRKRHTKSPATNSQ